MEKDLLKRATAFAEWAHEGQVRKYTGVPYITHCKAVSAAVLAYTNDPEMAAAAVLHDCVEDQPVKLEHIEYYFGKRVSELVEGLTDVSKPSDGNREQRKAIDREHTANSSADVHTIKLCDLIDNTQSICEHDPDFSKVYMREKQLLLPYLADGDARLYAKASILVKEYFEQREREKRT